MHDQNYSDTFSAFLSGTMSPETREAFRRRLQQDKVFKRAFIAYLLRTGASLPPESRFDRNTAQEIYAQVNPARYEKPSGNYLLRQQVREQWPRIAVAASILILVAVSALWYISNPSDPGSNLAEWMIDPISMERASATERQFFEKASHFYYQENPQVDSLEALAAVCTSFCIPKYYLAHAYLKMAKYDQALPLLESCLGNLDYINQVPQLQGSDTDLRINTLIARSALKKDRENILHEIEQLEKLLPPNDPGREVLHKLRRLK
ncbi:MAG: hypothetical protein KBF37_08750 [Saprospiraceae bacterium]|jgi:tetratricopeptide (TPR) repeat protein|nr:hypothetical protein [Saprospiraceae bacterium]MBP9210393.1 hypothetical protein [Saprospiraceae bacterium]MBV6472437.1 hypothetical protein [Saprospiraceae bacterium]